jgi:hypothetical protein
MSALKRHQQQTVVSGQRNPRRMTRDELLVRKETAARQDQAWANHTKALNSRIELIRAGVLKPARR